MPADAMATIGARNGIDHLKAAGDDGVELIRQLAEAVFSSGDIPEDWEKSFILKLHAQGKRGRSRPWKLPWLEAHRPGHEAAGTDPGLLHSQDGGYR